MITLTRVPDREQFVSTVPPIPLDSMIFDQLVDPLLPPPVRTAKVALDALHAVGEALAVRNGTSRD